MIKIIIIGGPTSSGKTELALTIAKKFNGELINADSRQIYKYLDIGTNKTSPPTPLLFKERGDHEVVGEVIHIIDFLNPDEQFSVFDFKRLAEEKIQEISNRRKLPILVGGTGLYIDAIIKDYELEVSNFEPDKEYRTYLNSLDIVELKNILITQNPELITHLNNSDKNNPHRLIRLIEKKQTSDILHSSINLPEPVLSLSKESPYQTLFLYPSFDWEELKQRIENRVDQMFFELSDSGFQIPEKEIVNSKRKTHYSKPHNIVDETKKVLNLGFPKDSIALQGIGYKQVIQYLDNKIDLKTCIELVKTAHKQYAKRQRTWFEGKGRGYQLIKVVNFIEADDEIRNFIN